MYSLLVYLFVISHIIMEWWYPIIFEMISVHRSKWKSSIKPKLKRKYRKEGGKGRKMYSRYVPNPNSITRTLATRHPLDIFKIAPRLRA